METVLVILPEQNALVAIPAQYFGPAFFFKKKP